MAPSPGRRSNILTPFLFLFLLVFIVAASAPTAGAQTVAPVGAEPSTLPVAVGTQVWVTATISDGVIGSSVVLQRIDAAGQMAATVAMSFLVGSRR